MNDYFLDEYCAMKMEYFEVVKLISVLNPLTLTKIVRPTTDFERVLGMTVVGSRLLILRECKKRIFSVLTSIDVYNIKSFNKTRDIVIPGAKILEAITSCLYSNCLYLGDSELKVIYRYDLQTKKVINKWSISVKCEGLSVTRRYNLLVTLHCLNEIQEYSPDGSLVRKIRLNDILVDPHHCVELSDDQFVVSYGGWWTKQVSGVCIVDNNGLIKMSHGGEPGSGVGQMRGPGQIVIDKHGYMMIADVLNNRVELLSPSLTHIRYVQIPGHELSGPWSLHLDELNHRLYISEGLFGGGRIFTFNVDTTL